MAENDPGLFCYMDQYSNPENWKAHYDHDSTGDLEAEWGIDYALYRRPWAQAGRLWERSATFEKN